MDQPYAILLCGGSGSRLWPLSRALRPKQLLALNGSETLLQQTTKRLLHHVAADHLITVTHEEHRFEVKGQLAEVATDAIAGVMAEPCARNTLPAVAWAVSQIYAKSPHALIGVFPSDHAVDNEAAFLVAWQTAELAAKEGYLALLGITPTEPATGYGYIQPSNIKVDTNSVLPVFEVSRFVEKPDLANAQKFVEDGYLWNSGMFVFKADIFMQMLHSLQPQLAEQIALLTPDNLATNYQALPNISMDHGLAELAEKVAVVPVDMAWSDLGSWDSIFQKRAKDDHGNVVQGEVVSVESWDSLFWNSHGLLATLGVSNLVVIQTADATLICDRNRTEDVKALVAKVQELKPNLTELHVTVQRPWGAYTVLEEGENYKIKHITVNPGSKLSMQLHHHRSEHWVVVSGTAKVTNDERVIILQENESTYIPKGNRHRLENPTDEPLNMIEVQCGDYVGEDDIVRFEDTYGRKLS